MGCVGYVGYLAHACCTAPSTAGVDAPLSIEIRRRAAMTSTSLPATHATVPDGLMHAMITRAKVVEAEHIARGKMPRGAEVVYVVEANTTVHPVLVEKVFPPSVSVGDYDSDHSDY